MTTCTAKKLKLNKLTDVVNALRSWWKNQKRLQRKCSLKGMVVPWKVAIRAPSRPPLDIICVLELVEYWLDKVVSPIIKILYSEDLRSVNGGGGRESWIPPYHSTNTGRKEKSERLAQSRQFGSAALLLASVVHVNTRNWARVRLHEPVAAACSSFQLKVGSSIN